MPDLSSGTEGCRLGLSRQRSARSLVLSVRAARGPRVPWAQVSCFAGSGDAASRTLRPAARIGPQSRRAGGRATLRGAIWLHLVARSFLSNSMKTASMNAPLSTMLSHQSQIWNLI